MSSSCIENITSKIASIKDRDNLIGKDVDLTFVEEQLEELVEDITGIKSELRMTKQAKDLLNKKYLEFVENNADTDGTALHASTKKVLRTAKNAKDTGNKKVTKYIKELETTLDFLFEEQRKLQKEKSIGIYAQKHENKLKELLGTVEAQLEVISAKEKLVEEELGKISQEPLTKTLFLRSEGNRNKKVYTAWDSAKDIGDIVKNFDFVRADTGFNKEDILKRTSNDAMDLLYNIYDEEFRNTLMTSTMITYQGEKVTLEYMLNELNEGKVESVNIVSMMKTNPAFNFLVKEVDGQYSINDNVGMAILAGSTKGLADNLEGIYTPNNEGLTGVVPIGSLAGRIGQSILMNLGLKEGSDKDTDPRYYQGLEEGFGELGIDLLVAQGFLQNPNKYVVDGVEKDFTEIGNRLKGVEKEEERLRIEKVFAEKLAVENKHIDVDFPPGGSFIVTKFATPPIGSKPMEELKTLRALDELIVRATGFEEDGRTPYYPSTEEVTPSSKVQRFDMDVGVVQQAATEVLSEQKMKLNSATDIIMEMIEKNEKGVKEALGYVEETSEYILDENGKKEYIITKDEQLRNAGKRLQINNIIADIKEFVALSKEREANGEDPIFFQEWFVAKQGRLHVKNTAVNYMEDKKLIRWMFAPEGFSYSRESESLYDIIQGTTTYENISEENWMFMDGIVQGFADIQIKNEKIEGIDKEHPKYVLRKFQEIMSTDKEVVEKAIEERMLKAEHPGHAALALSNVLKLHEAIESRSDFESDIYVEYDGKTNGVFHRLFQFADTEYADKFGEKVGLYTTADTRGKILRTSNTESTREDDVYVESGKEVNRQLVEGIESLEDSVEKNIITDIVNTLEVKDTFTKKEWSDIRKVAKDPTMTLQYGEGLDSLYEKFTRESISKLGSIAVENKKLPSKYAGLPLGDGKVLGQKEWTQFRNEVLNKPILAVTNTGVGGLITRSLFGVVKEEGVFQGTPTAVTLAEKFYEGYENVFKSQIDIASAIAGLQGFLFENIAKRIVQDLEELRARKDKPYYNKYEVEQVIAKYKHLLPGAEGFSFTEDLDSKLYFYKNKAGFEKRLNVAKKDGKNFADALSSYDVLDTSGIRLSEPGAASGPVWVHNIDSVNISLALVDTYVKYGFTFMPMHDAIILAPNMGGVVKSMNMFAYSVNTSISGVEQMLNEIERVGNELNIQKLNRNQQRQYNLLKEAVYDNKMLRDYMASNANNITVSQFNGYPGSAYEVTTEGVEGKLMFMDNNRRQYLLDTLRSVKGERNSKGLVGLLKKEPKVVEADDVVYTQEDEINRLQEEGNPVDSSDINSTLNNLANMTRTANEECK